MWRKRQPGLGGFNRHLLHTHASRFQGAPLVLLGKTAKNDDVLLRGLHHTGVQRQTQAGVKNHAHQPSAAFQAAAVCQQRIVGDDRAHAHQDGIALMTHLMHAPAALLASDVAGRGRAG